MVIPPTPMRDFQPDSYRIAGQEWNDLNKHFGWYDAYLMVIS